MKNKMTLAGRILTILAGLSVLSVIFFPLWQIQLAAPQYPEGLVLLIYPNKLGGNIDIINGLNHYIGMKPLHTEDFYEFKILTYIILFFFAVISIAGLLGKRKLLNIVFVLFLVFGIVAMVDFWKWEYNYGHNLNPDAAIIVPGMAYQPPLIGFKQLLNFGAYSIPDIGGWLFVSSGLLLLIVVIIEWKSFRKKKFLNPITAILSILLFSSSCKSKPVPLVIGKDACDFCKMILSDNRFGAEMISQKGKIYKFDDAHCAISFINSAKINQSGIAEIYFTDFCNGHTLIQSKDAIFLKSPALRGPMGGDISAFSNTDSLKYVMKKYTGTVIHWDELNK